MLQRQSQGGDDGEVQQHIQQSMGGAAHNQNQQIQSMGSVVKTTSAIQQQVLFGRVGLWRVVGSGHSILGG